MGKRFVGGGEDGREKRKRVLELRITVVILNCIGWGEGKISTFFQGTVIGR
jgi:hypothetical protein